jgi:succinoglycan biosynthesis transport protein ExoP
MERELLGTQRKLNEARAALTDFQGENKIAKIDEENQHLTGLKTDFQKSLEETTVKALEVGKKLETLQEQVEKERKVFGESSIGMTSPLVEALERQLSDLEGKLAAAKVNFSDSHPQVVSMRAEYEQKKKDLSKEIDRITSSAIKSPGSFLEHLRQEMVNLAVEKEMLQARIKGLGKGISNIEGRVTSLGKIQAEYHTLNREVEQYQRLSETLQATLEEATAQEHREMANVVVIDKATPPETAVFPNLVLNLIVAMGMGLVGGVFYAYFVDYLDRLRLNLEEDIKELEKEYV